MPNTITIKDITGRTLTLSQPFRVSAYSGFGFPAPRNILQRSIYRAGHKTVHTSWEGRVMTLTLEVTPGGLTLAARRDELNAYLAQLRAGVRVFYDREDGRRFETTARLGSEIPGHRSGQDGGTTWQRIVLSMVADDPWWFGDSHLWSFAVAAGSGNWAFPLPFPMGFGASIIDARETRRYAGQHDAFPVITVMGPADAMVITNESLDLKLDLSAYTIAAGEVVTFNLREDYKTVISSTAGSLIHELSEDSDLGFWRIGAHPYPSQGDNTIHVYLEDATNETTIQVTYRERYMSA